MSECILRPIGEVPEDVKSLSLPLLRGLHLWSLHCLKTGDIPSLLSWLNDSIVHYIWQEQPDGAIAVESKAFGEMAFSVCLLVLTDALTLDNSTPEIVSFVGTFLVEIARWLEISDQDAPFPGGRTAKQLHPSLIGAFGRLVNLFISRQLGDSGTTASLTGILIGHLPLAAPSTPTETGNRTSAMLHLMHRHQVVKDMVFKTMVDTIDDTPGVAATSEEEVEEGTSRNVDGPPPALSGCIGLVAASKDKTLISETAEKLSNGVLSGLGLHPNKSGGNPLSLKESFKYAKIMAQLASSSTGPCKKTFSGSCLELSNSILMSLSSGAEKENDGDARRITRMLQEL
jgi:hypothetical protein